MQRVDEIEHDIAQPGGYLAHLASRPDTPCVIRGLAADWPAVKASREGPPRLIDYLRSYAAEEDVLVFLSEAREGGRIFYNEDFSGFNFTRATRRLGRLLDEFAEPGQPNGGPACYVGSTPVDRCLPGFRHGNDLDLEGRAAAVSLWMGSPSSVAAHFDFPHNIACVVAGRRRFTLFPPEQLPNLYVGPLDLTPAGQPISLVDVNAPDLAAYPKYATAMASSMIAELESGDALYLPSLWWHAVDATDPFNLLINYWWQPGGAQLGTPFYTLLQAILAMGQLSGEQRQAWRGLFDHYAFSGEGLEPEHIPEHARGILGQLDRQTLAGIKANLKERISRQLT